MKRIAILQSNYIPWKGYFDLIQSVDEFIILDTVQYTKNDWRNRNKIKTKNGIKWLTISVKQKGCNLKNINETEIADLNWFKVHLETLYINYCDVDNFKEIFKFIESCYEQCIGVQKLSEINETFIKRICKVLHIDTKITRAEKLNIITENPSNRLVDICKATGATHYLSGPSAKNYLDLELFKANGIEVEWMNYDGYPEYKQLHGDFSHQVSIVDLLFNTGLDSARKYIVKN